MAYKVESHDYLALALIEEWCQGIPSSIIQLNRERACILLDNYVNQPSVYFLSDPVTPLEWEDEMIEDIHKHLKQNAAPVYGAFGKAGTAARDEDDGPISNRHSAFGARSRPSRTAASPTTTDRRKKQFGMVGVDAGQMEIDGSPNFLAIKLFGRTHANYPTALDLLRDEGFRNEPSNGRWWLRYLFRRPQDLHLLRPPRLPHHLCHADRRQPL
ncbi:MAG: hypothetical protein MK080_01840 [Opitutales bacterium]|nr:hypothetical protein [Opitutales bacterium]